MQACRCRVLKDRKTSALYSRAYLAFEKGAAEMLFHVQLVVGIGVPPSIKGGLWSYPVVYRSHRSMVDAMSTMVVAFARW
jgi:hypothetical protein